jgi:signal peptidase II
MTISKKTVFFLIPLLVIIIDRVTKLAATHFLKDMIHPKEIIPGFLNFIYSTNRGALFGIFNNLNESLRFFLLTILPLLVILVIVWMLIKSDAKDTFLNFGLSLILGGAIGNLIDRIMYGEVIDFIDFYITKFHWHTFNLADASITTGIVIILYQLIFMKPEKN